MKMDKGEQRIRQGRVKQRESNTARRVRRKKRVAGVDWKVAVHKVCKQGRGTLGFNTVYVIGEHKNCIIKSN